MLGWSWLIERYYPKPAPQSVPVSSSAETAPSAAPSARAAPQAAARSSRETPVIPDRPGGKSAPNESIAIETDSIKARFTTAGGCLVSWQLKTHLATGGSTFEELIPLRTQVGSQRFNSPGPLSVRLSDFPECVRWPATVRLEPRGDGKPDDVVFMQKLPEGRELTKRISLGESGYLAEMQIEITGPKPEWLEVIWSPGVGFSPDEEDALGRDRTFWNVSEAAYLTAEDIIRRKEGKRPLTREGERPFWAAVHNKYFVAAFLPPQPEEVEGVNGVFGMAGSAGLLETGGFFLAPKTVKPDELSAGIKFMIGGGAGRISIPMRIYIGPQDYGRLRTAAPRLEKVINFGFFGIIALPLMHILNFLARFIHNYGLAIILLTLLVKVVLWWPSQWGLKQMKGMQALQPKMKFISEQFKDDPKRKQEEMMRLYKEAGVNPAAGCLPILLQIPIFFALYTVLRTSIELRGAPFAFWIHDLSAKDPYYVLPLLVGATMYLQQAMMPTVGDPQQAKMMRWFSLGFILIFINFPAGFMLYFLVQNVTQIAQQWYTNRQPATKAAGRT